MLGYQEEEVNNSNDAWDKLIHPHDKESALQELNRHLSGETETYEFLQVLLAKKVTRISRARNGEEVLRFLTDERPDLILMDLKMPGMDGYEATREIRKDDATIPIIALTAYSQPEEKKMAAEAGCTLFISKPIWKHTSTCHDT